MSSTYNGTSDTVLLNYYSVANAGSHSLSINVTGATGSNFFTFAWCGVAPRQAYEAGQPYVVVAGVPRNQVAADATTAAYNNAASALVTSFAQDGLQVSFADVRRYVNDTPLTTQSPGTPPVCYTTPTTADLYCDGVHLTAQGHQHARDAIEAAIVSGVYQQQTYGRLPRSCGSFTTTAATSDVFSCAGATPGSTCSLTPTNSTAAGISNSVYISAKNQGSITINHAATAGATFDVSCSLH